MFVNTIRHQRETEIDRNRQKETEKGKKRRKKTKSDRKREEEIQTYRDLESDRQTDKEREREEEMNILSSIILHVQEVLSNFHRILTTENWTRILGQTLSRIIGE